MSFCHIKIIIYLQMVTPRKSAKYLRLSNAVRTSNMDGVTGKFSKYSQF